MNQLKLFAQVVREGSWVDAWKEGLWREWFEDGTPRSEGHYYRVTVTGPDPKKTVTVYLRKRGALEVVGIDRGW